jgi:hypothetical protein
MAAYEDFEFFRTGATSMRRPRPASPRIERDTLRAELERLHVEVTHLRAKVRRRDWPKRLARLVRRIVPRPSESPLREIA